MYTQCPGCSTIFRVDARTLKAKQGEVVCHNCRMIFNAITSRGDPMSPSVTEHPQTRDERPRSGRLKSGFSNYKVNGADGESDSRFSREAPSDRYRYPSSWDEDGDGGSNQPEMPGLIVWGAAALLMGALLVWQIKVFEGARIAQNERLRPWLEMFCENFECELPPYQDVHQIQVVDRALHPAPSGIDGYEFSLVLANQSSLAQIFPSIKLVLAELNGRSIATRVFSPDEYLGEPPPATMPVGKPFEIKLLIAKPSREIGGFSFELI